MLLRRADEKTSRREPESQPVKQYYLNQGGWDDYVWGGVFRLAFVFTDSLQTGGCLSIHDGEGEISGHLLDGEENFAGIV